MQKVQISTDKKIHVRRILNEKERKRYYIVQFNHLPSGQRFVSKKLDVTSKTLWETMS